ncbi:MULTISPECIES: DeoR/GlpR family DNA-binding transcription regulator [Lacrimispora]|jgi:DeoR family myo-inositol catabolism operon transcriptional repressor|uniref:DeoR/GlpR family DNA-binding transcription regulator n=1 Tax=Lacrimispora TaxID=2719231 RepID=UPI000446DBFA|nr:MULTISPECIES: DeoR/GlpR family DNA-binding transcription regulator [Lacrimispora]EXG83815.1 transcriptional regulator of sugar metabolism [Clostridium sp. ASBs410]MDR7812324.1 DeoR/GlpR family DNA-binding transcription regulator [Lacrimispora sp.]SET86330.1 transcriptional regulator, DeoR family [Lacrimispora sphenoides]
MRISRIDQLEQYILEHRTASIDTLCEEFKISKNTLRRDLEILVARGTVEKVYGGVIACENASPIPNLVTFHERAGRNAQSKQRIAALAASFVRERDIIFIDSGTTTMGIVDHLAHLSTVTVITNSLQVINKSMNYPNINLIVLPGSLKRDTASLVGSSCVEYLEDYNIVRAFMACTAISLQAGVCNASTEEYIIKKTALKKSQKHYLLADSSKFGRTSLMTFGEIGQFDCILTEQMPDDEFSSYCKDQDCAIQIAPES